MSRSVQAQRVLDLAEDLAGLADREAELRVALRRLTHTLERAVPFLTDDSLKIQATTAANEARSVLEQTEVD